MAYVYLLQSEANGRFYIGSTTNIERRLEEHNDGKSHYTKLTRPFKLVFKQEYKTYKQARIIEYKLKKLKRRDILVKISTDGYIKMGG